MEEKFKRFGMGRLSSPFDFRDYNLKDFIPKTIQLKQIKEANWEFPSKSLDQKETPHCVGFSMANFGINYPVSTPHTNEDAHAYYYECKVVDGEPNAENGSYIRTAAKVLKNKGIIEGYAFAPDMATIKYWLLNKGCMIVGTIWNYDMFNVKEDGTIGIGGETLGGHAYLLNEWRSDNYIGIQNSWGDDWGKNGKAYIAASDFEKLFIHSGEALAAVELVEKQTKKPCIIKDFFKSLKNKE
jgi:hypothetical protein